MLATDLIRSNFALTPGQWVRLYAFDESKVKRGKTSPGSTPGSFAPQATTAETESTDKLGKAFKAEYNGEHNRTLEDYLETAPEGKAIRDYLDAHSDEFREFAPQVGAVYVRPGHEGKDGKVSVEAFAQAVRTSWNSESGGKNDLSWSLQMAVGRVFKKDIHMKMAGEDFQNRLAFERAEEYMNRNPQFARAMEAYVRANYAHTQEFLRERGIKEVNVYRGVPVRSLIPDHDGKASYLGSLGYRHDKELKADLGSIDTTSRPVTSWSADAYKAVAFGEGRSLMVSRVPASQVFSLSPAGGLGTNREKEIVLLGGNATHMHVVFRSKMKAVPRDRHDMSPTNQMMRDIVDAANRVRNAA